LYYYKTFEKLFIDWLTSRSKAFKFLSFSVSSSSISLRGGRIKSSLSEILDFDLAGGAFTSPPSFLKFSSYLDLGMAVPAVFGSLDVLLVLLF